MGSKACQARDLAMVELTEVWQRARITAETAGPIPGTDDDNDLSKAQGALHL